jgi:hypothetical protein
MASAPTGFIQSLQETVALGVHDYNFKNGAFKSSISRDMPPHQSLQILQESSLTALCEKEVIDAIENVLLLATMNGNPHTFWANFKYLDDMNMMFQKDALSRHGSTEDLKNCAMGADGDVTETQTVLDEVISRR